MLWTDRIQQTADLVVARYILSANSFSALLRPLRSFRSRWYARNDGLWVKNTENAPMPASANSYWLFFPGDALETFQMPVPGFLSCALASMLHTSWFTA